MLDIKGPIRLTPVQWQLATALNLALISLPMPFIDLDTVKEVDETLKQPFMITERDCHRVATWVSVNIGATIAFDRPSLAFYRLPETFSFSIRT